MRDEFHETLLPLRTPCAFPLRPGTVASGRHQALRSPCEPSHGSNRFTITSSSQEAGLPRSDIRHSTKSKYTHPMARPRRSIYGKNSLPVYHQSENPSCAACVHLSVFVARAAGAARRRPLKPVPTSSDIKLGFSGRGLQPVRGHRKPRVHARLQQTRLRSSAHVRSKAAGAAATG